MTESAIARLEGELGAKLKVLEQLSEEDADALTRLFQAARKAEAKALMKSVKETIDALPWMFRGPARKIVFPEGRK